jgi:phenylpyruvate tautomerase PptA (4-oxalocrotonate tautomerase family)
MVIYNCTTTESTLSAEQKSELANEIIRIHSAFNHVPVTHINVVFIELPANSVKHRWCAREPAFGQQLVSGRPPGVRNQTSCRRNGRRRHPGNRDHRGSNNFRRANHPDAVRPRARSVLS